MRKFLDKIKSHSLFQTSVTIVIVFSSLLIGGVDGGPGAPGRGAGLESCPHDVEGLQRNGDGGARDRAGGGCGASHLCATACVIAAGCELQGDLVCGRMCTTR